MIKKALLILIIPLSFSFGQKIGKIAPEKPPVEYPPHSWGIDIMFSEGGLGLGTFFRKSITFTGEGSVP